MERGQMYKYSQVFDTKLTTNIEGPRSVPKRPSASPATLEALITASHRSEDSAGTFVQAMSVPLYPPQVTLGTDYFQALLRSVALHVHTGTGLACIYSAQARLKRMNT
ncbi:hypothetical protein PT974_06254 [Cladobotryum mycophilum]|uniref:Uncharacterized protein n=1 Tax=Cladobotryum mycophilum TaxID=491253 RepID=A0ABR0SL19_9HYPO